MVKAIASLTVKAVGVAEVLGRSSVLATVMAELSKLAWGAEAIAGLSIEAILSILSELALGAEAIAVLTIEAILPILSGLALGTEAIAVLPIEAVLPVLSKLALGAKSVRTLTVIAGNLGRSGCLSLSRTG